MRRISVVLPCRGAADIRRALDIHAHAAGIFGADVIALEHHGARVLLLVPLRSRADIARGLRVLDYANLQYGPVPDPLTAGVVYRCEPQGEENWCVWVIALEQGHEDCEGLASWLGAYLGGRSLAYPAGPSLIHCVTEAPDGRIIDPSKALGMKGAG